MKRDRPPVVGVPIASEASGAIESSRRAPKDLAPSPMLLPLVDPRSPVTERYRRMMTHVDHLGARDDHPYRMIVMTSSREAEGKTLTSMNLSLVLAEDRDRKGGLQQAPQ